MVHQISICSLGEHENLNSNPQGSRTARHSSKLYNPDLSIRHRKQRGESLRAWRLAILVCTAVSIKRLCLCQA